MHQVTFWQIGQFLGLMVILTRLLDHSRTIASTTSLDFEIPHRLENCLAQPCVVSLNIS